MTRRRPPSPTLPPCARVRFAPLTPVGPPHWVVSSKASAIGGSRLIGPIFRPSASMGFAHAPHPPWLKERPLQTFASLRSPGLWLRSLRSLRSALGPLRGHADSTGAKRPRRPTASLKGRRRPRRSAARGGRSGRPSLPRGVSHGGWGAKTQAWATHTERTPGEAAEEIPSQKREPPEQGRRYTGESGAVMTFNTPDNTA